jgi:hypothetical protein
MKKKNIRRESSNNSKEQLGLQPLLRGLSQSELPFERIYSNPNNLKPNILLQPLLILMMTTIFMTKMMT